jgi:methylenetetrahydrofolate dehydrogenase (NADP+)/methenyltetrahydrofolate cyclohydrolase
VRLIDGRAIAAAIKTEVTGTVEQLRAAGTTPTLAVVVPTDDEASAWYVRSIQRTAERVGIDCIVDQLHHPDATELAKHLDAHCADPAVHGVICQTPLPAGLLLEDIAGHIAPAKDVDGVNPTSLGRLATGMSTYPPATAAAVLEVLHHEQVTLTGARAVVVGRSTVVGKPAALLLLAENATVTVCHSHTADLPDVCAQADILVVAVGRPEMIDAAYIKPGAIVIDVGTNPTDDGGLVGDVKASTVADLDGAITPVPGGVGPITTMMLMRHTADAARSFTA